MLYVWCLVIKCMQKQISITYRHHTNINHSDVTLTLPVYSIIKRDVFKMSRCFYEHLLQASYNLVKGEGRYDLY